MQRSKSGHTCDGEKAASSMSNGIATEEHVECQQELDVLASISTLLAERSGQREMLTRVLHQLEQELGMRNGTVIR